MTGPVLRRSFDLSLSEALLAVAAAPQAAIRPSPWRETDVASSHERCRPASTNDSTCQEIAALRDSDLAYAILGVGLSSLLGCSVCSLSDPIRRSQSSPWYGVALVSRPPGPELPARVGRRTRRHIAQELIAAVTLNRGQVMRDQPVRPFDCDPDTVL
jgi:hypothetical protein